MMNVRKLLLIGISAFMVTAVSSCSNKKNHNEIENAITKPQYTNVIVAENKDENIKIYGVNKKELAKIEDREKFSQILYTNKDSTFVYLMKDKENEKKNNIKILSNNVEDTINNFFWASDLNMSPNGGKIAYRTFKREEIDSIEGLTLYDTNKNISIKFDSKVTISGNLYTWINEKEILYYGVDSDTEKKGIYKYNTETKKENVYLENMDGYCMYFMYFDNKLLVLSSNRDKDNLYIYNNGQKLLLSNKVNKIYKGIYDKYRKIIYIIASDLDSEATLYKIDTEKNFMERLTYDLPEKVDENGGIGVSSDGLVYYCGFTSLNDNSNDVFMYNPEDNSNNLISVNPSKYHIFTSN
ncbi:hypothetical protein [Clostridium rectalis]|uniref:hypothetical protein n=1 Tax=Clostridium rectalis TaxID=2040295 RepID=UPI000F634A50|nr:hypothetical protein [Clostridium rectalis]